MKNSIVHKQLLCKLSIQVVDTCIVKIVISWWKYLQLVHTLSNKTKILVGLLSICEIWILYTCTVVICISGLSKHGHCDIQWSSLHNIEMLCSKFIVCVTNRTKICDITLNHSKNMKTSENSHRSRGATNGKAVFGLSLSTLVSTTAGM